MAEFVTPASLTTTNNNVTALAAGMGAAIALDRVAIGPFAAVTSVALANLKPLPAGTTIVQTAGYYAAGDGGRADYAAPGDMTRPDSMLLNVAGVMTWFTQVHADGIDLIKFGCRADRVTDDTDRVSQAITLANTLGLNKVYGQPGRGIQTRNLKVGFSTEFDLRGGAITPATLTTIGLTNNGTINALYTDLADGVSLTFRNGEIDGGFRNQGTSLFGSRALNFKGGLIRYIDVVFRGTSNRSANGTPPLDIFDQASYTQGNIVATDCRGVLFERCTFRGMGGEQIIVVSSDNNTLLQVVDCVFDKRREQDNTVNGSSAIGAFNVNSASCIVRSRFSNFASSPVNWLSDGGWFDGNEFENVVSTPCLDFSEVAHTAFGHLDVRNCKFTNITQVIRSSSRDITIHNIDITGGVNATNAIVFEGITTGANWTGTWFPAAGSRELPNIRLSQIRYGGVPGAAITVLGASEVLPAHIHIDGLLYDSTKGALGTHAIRLQNAIAYLSGAIEGGSAAMIRLQTSGNITFNDAILAPGPASDTILLENVTTPPVITFNDSRRPAALGGGEFDVVATGTTSAPLAIVNVNGGNGTINTFPTTFRRIFIDGAMQPSIADDAVFNYTPLKGSGIMAVMANDGTGSVANTVALIDYRAATTPRATLLTTASLVSVGTTTLAAGGTGGVDGSLNLAFKADGTIDVKNRLNSTNVISLRPLLRGP